MSFAGDVASFSRKSGLTADQIIRGFTIKLTNAIVKGTPKDTGRAQGNWQTTTDAPADGVVDRVGASSAIAESVSNAGGAGKVTYITNNLPYIFRLENGWSGQAPAGMVRLNIERMVPLLEAEVQKLKI